MDLTTLEAYLQLMKQYNVETLETEGFKVTVKIQGPEIEKKKPTIEKLDRLANLPSPEELEMWSTGIRTPDSIEKVLPKRTTKKAE